jgi:hypothetical protein
MALVTCPDCGREVSDLAPACPNCGRPMAARPSPSMPPPGIPPKKSSSRTGCFVLAILAVVGLYALGSVAEDANRSLTNVDASLSSAPVDTAPRLEVTNWTWHQEYSYAIVEGEVRNISGASMDNVTAVARFYSADRTFITSDDALIDYRPLLPGQSSPFKIMQSWNPAMKSAGLEFREFGGRAINWREAEKKNKKKP